MTVKIRLNYHQWQRSLPEAQGSIHCTTDNTKEIWRSPAFSVPNRASSYQIVATVEWFDKVNGANHFYCRTKVVLVGGTQESEYVDVSDAPPALTSIAIAKHIEGLKAWNGWYSFGPWYYIENSLFHASDRDCHGLRKGETKQLLTGGVTPVWRLTRVSDDGSPTDIPKTVDSDTPPPPTGIRLEYRPWLIEGEGGVRNFDAVRSIANWPEATEEQMCSDDLAVIMMERLPAKLVEFRKLIERLGFTW